MKLFARTPARIILYAQLIIGGVAVLGLFAFLSLNPYLLALFAFLQMAALIGIGLYIFALIRFATHAVPLAPPVEVASPKEVVAVDPTMADQDMDPPFGARLAKSDARTR